MLCCALWGSAFPFIKIGYGLLNIASDDTPSQLLFAGIRFFAAGILVIVFGSLNSKRIILPKRKSVSSIVVLSVFQTIMQYIFFYIGLSHTTGTKGSVLNSTSVFFVLILACVIFRQEKLNLQKIIGCMIGFAGTVIINLSQGGVDGGISFLGEGFIILSSLSYAVSSVLMKKYSSYENPVALSGYQFMLGGAVMTAAGLFAGGRLGVVSVKAVLLLLYLALVSAAAYTVWGILLKYNDVSKVAVFSFMTPVFGCIFSAMFLKESLAGSLFRTIISLFLVSAGVIIVNIKFNLKGDKI